MQGRAVPAFSDFMKPYRDSSLYLLIREQAEPYFYSCVRIVKDENLNIVNCAMLSAFLLSMPKRPSVREATEYYKKSMMTKPMKWFCRQSGKRKFSEKDILGMKVTAAFRAADRNPYSWNMEFYPYQDGSGYEARFTKCGICVLMRKLGLEELIPAMCRLDYTMSEAGGASEFFREYTIASGGPYCDCGYKRRKTC